MRRGRLLYRHLRRHHRRRYTERRALPCTAGPPHLLCLRARLRAGFSATAIAAGGEHTCAIVTGGAVKCWGYNGYGQLGIGSTKDQYGPASVGLGSGAHSGQLWQLCCVLADGSRKVRIYSPAADGR